MTVWKYRFISPQLWPHSNFGDEIKYISSHDKLQDRLKGSGYILGPITGDHWFVYVADHSETSALSLNRPLLELQPIVESPPSTGESTQDFSAKKFHITFDNSTPFVKAQDTEALFIDRISYYNAVSVHTDMFSFLPCYLQQLRTHHQPYDVRYGSWSSQHLF